MRQGMREAQAQHNQGHAEGGTDADVDEMAVSLPSLRLDSVGLLTDSLFMLDGRSVIAGPFDSREQRRRRRRSLNGCRFSCQIDAGRRDTLDLGECTLDATNT